MENKKFKKGTLVIISRLLPLRSKFNLPPVGKIACSEKVKQKHISNFPSFSLYHSSSEIAMVEFPNNAIKHIHFFKDLEKLLEDFNEYKLNSVFILERKIVIPIQKDFLIRPENNLARKLIRKRWNELKTK